jgi:hypothetical protein
MGQGPAAAQGIRPDSGDGGAHGQRVARRQGASSSISLPRAPECSGDQRWLGLFEQLLGVLKWISAPFTLPPLRASAG